MPNRSAAANNTIRFPSKGRPGGGGGVGGGGLFGAATQTADVSIMNANGSLDLIGTIFIGCKSI
jgi:hypothetical protein